MRRPVQPNKIAGLLDGRHGLSSSDVAQRRALYGYNEIVETRPAGWRDVLRDTIKDPMIWFLAATSALFGFMRDSIWREVRSIDLVLGDLVTVTPGSSFPADGLIVGGDSLQADESASTSSPSASTIRTSTW